MTTFDEAASYDAWYETAVGELTDALEKRAVFSLIRGSSGLALDLSCGTGNYAFELARRGWPVIGVDRSLAMLRRADSKGDSASSRPLFIAADAAALPLRDGSVALVTLVLGLEFMADPAQPLGEVHRVLRPDGATVIAVLEPTGVWNLWRRLKRRFVPSVWREARFVTMRQFARVLRDAGLVMRERRGAVHYVPVVRSVCLLERWERFATGYLPWLAAFVAVRCERDRARRPEPR